MSIRNRTYSGGPRSATRKLSVKTARSFCFPWNDISLLQLLVSLPFPVAQRQTMGRLSPVFSLITTQAEWYGLPHSGHFEVTQFPLFKQCICLSKGTNFTWVFKRTKRFQDLGNLICITLSQLFFYDLPNSPLCLLSLGSYV